MPNFCMTLMHARIFIINFFIITVRGKGIPSFDEMVAIILEEVDFDNPTTNVRGRRTLAITKPTPRGIDHAGARST